MNGAGDHDGDADAGHGAPDPSIKGRLSRRFLKPIDPTAPHAEVAPPRSVEELEADNRSMTDVERLIGLVMAPLAAVVTLILISQYVNNWKNQHPGQAHVPSSYSELFVVFLILAALIMVAAWFRKRMYTGLAIALFGLSIFSLNWKWLPIAGPFVLVGAWYLVRAYRAQQAVKLAGGDPSRWSPRAKDAGSAAPPGPSAPQPNKRYTPPTPKPKKALPKPEDGTATG